MPCELYIYDSMSRIDPLMSHLATDSVGLRATGREVLYEGPCIASSEDILL